MSSPGMRPQMVEGGAGTAGLPAWPHAAGQGSPVPEEGPPPLRPSPTSHRQMAALGFHHKDKDLLHQLQEHMCAGQWGGCWGVEQCTACTAVHGVRGTVLAQASDQGVTTALPDPAGSAP